MMQHRFKHLFFAVLLVLLLALMAVGTAAAQTSPIHPTFPLLDHDGTNVLVSGKPVSTMQTCAGCHNTELIEKHGFHSRVGLDNLTAPGSAPSGRPWDISQGLYGMWDPILYRYLSPHGDATIDLGTADWIKTYGQRHVGGGPAVTAQNGHPLTSLTPSATNPETATQDPKTGATQAWNWQESGVVENNCFLCHTPDPDNAARLDALQRGQFGWADTATLQNEGIVSRLGDAWLYNSDAFGDDGKLKKDYVKLQSPSAANCGQCHGKVFVGTESFLSYDDLATDNWTTQRTGQIFSGQRISDSALNLAHKETLTHSWDVHAERNLKCTDCHYAINNPATYQPPAELMPKHLTFEPRRPDIADYLQNPSHDLAHGPQFKAEASSLMTQDMRRCESCHDFKSTHTWLPYEDKHSASLSCEACHVPEIHAPALAMNDWTVVDTAGKGIVSYRGVAGDGDPQNPHNLIVGYKPILFPRANVDGKMRLAPYNLVSSWYWVYGEPARPVRQQDLQKAFLVDGQYKAGILAAFDTNGDGVLDKTELRIDTDSKQETVKAQLEALGLQNPRIEAEVTPYSLSHDVAYGDFVTKDCKACHSDASRVSQPMLLATYIPGNVQPHLLKDANMEFAGELMGDKDGALYAVPSTAKEHLYLPGHDRLKWIDWLGILMLLAVFAGVAVHGGLRLYADAHRSHTHHGNTRKLYLYTFYERLWHWLQALAILLLILTGIVVHRPDMFGAVDLGIVVPIHNVLGFLLLFNAFFSLFYFVAGRSIKQFLPAPKGFFYGALLQAKFYARGIFKGEAHPYEKSEKRKMNPLQQATYLVILNVLLPLQIITG
ncbi:MAG: hypothetical protein GXP37_03235, partial [Chloroflexi bacterium]|nr:hypothetical protein [Chloroflexota bacterium]